MRLTKVFSVSLMCSLFLLSVLGVAGQNGPAVASNARILPCATETDNDMVRADTLWKNIGNDTTGGGIGLPSMTLLGNNDTIGGKSCNVVDDFVIPAGETWTITKIVAYMFCFGKKAPDSCRFFIYEAINGAAPDETNNVGTFAVRAIMPIGYLTAITNTAAKNIVLNEGMYWLNVRGEYKTFSTADTSYTYWWVKKDTLVGDSYMLCRDSIGVCFDPYPTDWVGVLFEGQTDPYNAVRFVILGNKNTEINTSNKIKHPVSAFVYPNPASDNITFQLNNPAVRYIQIYDMKGKLLQTVSAKTSRKKVHLNGLTNGIYMYQLLDASKMSVDRGRFSVSK